MTRAGQTALIIMCAVLLVLAGGYVVIARQQAITQEHNTCVSELRSQWESSVGDIIIAAAKQMPITHDQVVHLQEVQNDLTHLNDACPTPGFF